MIIRGKQSYINIIREMNCMNEKEFIDDFVINPLTLAILPMEYEGKLYSKVYQLDEETELFVPFKPLDLIKSACITYGSSYEGRKDASRYLIGITHKIPISIDPTNSIYFFPTNSPDKSTCGWIAYDHVKTYSKVDTSNTLVTFHNNVSIVIPISRYSFDNQIKRTALLHTKLMQNIREYDSRFQRSFDNYSKASENISLYGKKYRKKG